MILFAFQNSLLNLMSVQLIVVFSSVQDWAKRRVMGKLTLGDDEYSSVSLAANEVLYDAASESAVAREGKHPRESQVGIEYPFSTDQYLLETYRNPWGEIRL